MAERVLIVDDELSTLRLLGMALEREGYVISAAQDADKALVSIDAALPDLIILDVMLPGVSGLEFCAQLRARPDTATIPILILSAKGEVPDKIAGLQAGADEYVVKPVETAELVARVASLMERTRRLRSATPAAAPRMTTLLGAKGGCGTTTLLINLGVSLALRKLATVACELRPYPGSAGLLIGVHSGKSLADLLRLPARSITAQEVERQLAVHTTGLKLLPSPEDIVEDRQIEPEQAAAILDGLDPKAAHRLVDLPPAIGPAGRVALEKSDSVLLLVDPVRDSVEAGRVAADYVRGLASAGAALGLVVVNRAPIASPMAPAEIEERIGWEIRGQVPPAADQCALAQQRGIPIVQLQPEAVISQAIKRLADLFD
ncbi:MAG: response regulator [Anaerolineales bacterium]|nr:response regulator [Anaerolineales bacterium]